MNRRIEEIRQKLAAERALPEDQRWAMDEQQLRDLADRAAGGDTQAAQFLELARDRMKRLRRERLEKTWGRVLNHPDAAVELQAHARRMAELEQIRVLARVRNFSDLSRRAEELSKAEQLRHEERMKAIAADVHGIPVAGAQP